MLGSITKLTQRIGAKHLAHAIMVTFAAASLFNISDFIYTLHHNTPLSWTVAIALAASLVVFSALLSEMKWRSSGFYITLVVVCGLTAISGFIQGGAYALAIGWPGWAMGFAMPVFGELGASLALSVYAKEQHARSMDEAQQQLSDGVRRTIIDALGSVDRSKVEAQVNRAVNLVTKELIDASIHDMIAELRANRAPVLVDILQSVDSQATTNFTLAVENRPIVDSDHIDFQQKMSDGKRKKATERQAALFDILQREFNGANSDDVNKSHLAERLGVSRQTVIKDFEALTVANRISVNGHIEVVI